MRIDYYKPIKINEEWATEAPVGTDWSFLPEAVTSALTPNFLNVSQPPLGNLSVEGEEEEIQRILLLQEYLNEDDLKFISKVDTEAPSVYYEWLCKCGQKPSMSKIKSFGLTEEQKTIINKIKEGVKRKRPYIKESKVNKLVECEGYSYPSKTTTECYMMAEGLSECYPHLREGLYALANKMANTRIQAGVHYPTDVEAAKSISKALLAK
jgi:hypothetical protein